MSSPPPELQQLALNFLATFLVATLLYKQRPYFSRHGPRSSSVGLWALYVALSSLTPFYANLYGLPLLIRLFQGPLYTVMGPFTPVLPVGERSSEWSAPALQWSCLSLGRTRCDVLREGEDGLKRCVLLQYEFIRELLARFPQGAQQCQVLSEQELCQCVRREEIVSGNVTAGNVNKSYQITYVQPWLLLFSDSPSFPRYA